ncbi:MAG: hypothetical protein JO015_13265 [Verrucomicrobia bacterium]|nr:hypothetical protein [Verrucomicrobiota bacterium]
MQIGANRGAIVLAAIRLAREIHHSTESYSMNPSPEQTPLRIGSLLFPRRDQLDFTGPFEVFSRLPGASLHLRVETNDETVWGPASPPRTPNRLPLGAWRAALADDPERFLTIAAPPPRPTNHVRINP